VVEICRTLPGIKSIAVVGSHAKGDGEFVHRRGQPTPVRDLDVLLVFGGIVPRRKVARAMELINSLYKQSESEYYLDVEFMVELKATTFFWLTHLADLATYDVKFSVTIWGVDVAPYIRLVPEEIPLRTNVRALTQKGIGMIGVLNEEYLDHGVPPDRQEVFLRETSRAYQEVATGLCLAAGFYSPAVNERVEFLSHVFHKTYPGLAENSPGLFDRIDHWAKVKMGEAERGALDLIQFWLRTRDDLLLVMKEMSVRALGLDITSPHTAASQGHEVTRRFYGPLFAPLLGGIAASHLDRYGSALGYAIGLRDVTSLALRRGADGRLADTRVSIRTPPGVQLLLAVPQLLSAVSASQRFQRDRIQVAAEILGVGRRTNEVAWGQAKSALLGIVDLISFV